ncbi:glutamate-cysteine ligase family protein [Nanoarchaeota archaeon]
MPNNVFLRILEPIEGQFEPKTLDKTGMELEVLLLDKDGIPTPQADEIINGIGKAEGYHQEISLASVETVTEPHNNIFETALDLMKRAKRLDEIAKGAGLLTLPLDTSLIPYEHERRHDSDVAGLITKTIGLDGLEIKTKVNGTHIHFSQEEGKVIDQMNYLTASDPVTILLTSASPIEGFHNWRIHNYRNIAHRKLPYQGQMQDLKRSLEEHEAEVKAEFKKFKQRAVENGHIFTELDYYDEYCSISGPVRLSPKHSTVEARTAGSNPYLYNLIAYLTLLEGGMRRIRSGDVKGVTNPLLESVLMKDDLKGDSKKLKRLHDDAARYGLNNTENNEYCISFLEFAHKGLEDREKAFVDRFIGMTYDGETAADYIKEAADSRTVNHNIHRAIYEDVYVPQREFMLRALTHLTKERKDKQRSELPEYVRRKTQEQGSLAGLREELVFA